MRRFVCLSLFGILIAPHAGAEEAIPPEEWREMTSGKTLWYYKDGEPYGREYYVPGGDRVIFRFADGNCVEGRWGFADGKYCFAFGAQLHCFRHVRRDDGVYVIGEDEEDVQSVRRFAEFEPLSCLRAVES